MAAGTGTPAAVSVASSITFTAGAFNLNGIVALRGGQRLVVVQTDTGALWRIDVDRSPAQIEQVDAPLVVGGDGMIRDKGRLVVVIGTPAVATDPSNLTFVKLRHHDSRGRIDKVVTDPTLRGPSTVARDENRYLVVNADFATPPSPAPHRSRSPAWTVGTASEAGTSPTRFGPAGPVGRLPGGPIGPGRPWRRSPTRSMMAANRSQERVLPCRPMPNSSSSRPDERSCVTGTCVPPRTAPPRPGAASTTPR